MRRLTAALIAFVLSLGTADRSSAAEPPRLIPQPRELRVVAPVPLPRGVTIDEPRDEQDRFAAADLTEALRERGVRVGRGGSVSIHLQRASSPGAAAVLQRNGVRVDSAMAEEGYAIVVEGRRAHVIAPSAAGVFYGVQTLKQLIEGDGAGAHLNGVIVRDWPAMRYRGFHDDLSRGPVPTLDFQKKQIRTMAAYKINVYSPYFEHTLEYTSHPLIAPPGGAVTHEQARELVEYARRYHVTIVPQQQTFGHLHHMLKHETYAPLAETSHGHVLAPGQSGALPVVRQMFAEIDSLFPGPFLHIGADETFELGRGQSAERVQREGIGAVYLEFLRKIEAELRPLDRKLLFWGDVAMNHPELVKTLPRDLVAVAWAYGAFPSFDRYLTAYRDAGMETWVAPGVSSWNRVYPNYATALTNIRNFIRDGQRMGSLGVLNTAWDDDGEAIFNQTWYGVLFGAAASWQPGESSIEEFQRSYGRVFHGDTTGRIDEAQRRLMAAHTLLQKAGLGDASNNLFWVDPWSREGQIAAQKIRPIARPLRLLAEEALVLIAQARPDARREHDALAAMELGARRIDLIGMKFQFADDISRLYAQAATATSDTATSRLPRREIPDIAGVNGRMQDLRDGYTMTRDLFEQAWLRENRPYWLRNVLARYDAATQLWIGRIDQVNQARQYMSRERKLPPATELGIPAPPAPAAAAS